MTDLSAQGLRELPIGWRWAPMSEVCSRVQDGTHFSPKEQTRTGDFKYITAKNIKHWGLDLSDVTYVPERIHRQIFRSCNVAKGDVLYIKDGVTTGIATVNTLDEEFSLLSSVALLKPRRDILDSFFLKYYLNSPAGFSNMTGQMTGTAIKRLILQKIKAAMVPVAPLTEQSRIVAEIEKQFTRLDAGIASLRRVESNLKRYRAAVFRAACEGQLTPHGAEHARSDNRYSTQETADELLARILKARRGNWPSRGKYSEPSAPDTAGMASLPAAWTWCSVAQLLREPLCNGVSVKGSDDPPGIPALRLNAMSSAGFDYSNVRYLPLPESKIDDLWIEAGDFFMSRGNGSLHLVGRGTSAQEPPRPTIFPDTMIRVRLADPIRTSGWVQMLWPSQFIRSQIEALVKTTAGIYKISQPQAEGIVIPLPPLDEQERIVAEVQRRLSVVDELESVVAASIQRATRLRQSILQKAFAGELV